MIGADRLMASLREAEKSIMVSVSADRPLVWVSIKARESLTRIIHAEQMASKGSMLRVIL